MIVELEVERLGDEAKNFGMTVSVGFQGSDGDLFQDFDSDCGGAFLEDDLLLAGDTAAGEPTTGSTCIAVEEAQLEGGVWRFENLDAMEDDVVYVAYDA